MFLGRADGELSENVFFYLLSENASLSYGWSFWEVSKSSISLKVYSIPHIQILFSTVGNCYIIIYTMLLFRSLKDNHKKITLASIVGLMDKKQCFQSRVRVPAGSTFS